MVPKQQRLCQLLFNTVRHSTPFLSTTPVSGSARTQVLTSEATNVVSSVLPADGAIIQQLGTGSRGASSSGFLAVGGALTFLLPMVLGTALAEDAKHHHGPAAEHGWHLLSLDARRKLFFKYEKRIRENSNLEKVFDYFCSEERHGIRYMTPLDLVTAIYPTYPASQGAAERSGWLDGERGPGTSSRPKPASRSALAAADSLFKQLDVDGDGLISFAEFKLLLTLVAIPEADVATIFDVVDLDGNGVVDAHEFTAVMDMLQDAALHSAGGGGSAGAKHSIGRNTRFTSAEGHAPSGLLVSFFGQDQKGKLELKQLRRFLSQLHHDLAELHFAHYDISGKGFIPGLDFAHSLVSSADMKKVDELLAKAEQLPASLKECRISQEDFSSVMGLHRYMHSLTVALEFMASVGKPVTSGDLAKLVKKLCGVSLSPHVLAIIMALFADEQGHLDSAGFLEVMRRKEVTRGRKPALGEEASGSYMERLWNCINHCRAAA